MTEPTIYEIVIKGRANPRLLRPLLDDFSFDHTGHGVTRLTGEIRDAAHLHGVVTHLTSVSAELISVAPVAQPTRTPTLTRHERNEAS